MKNKGKVLICGLWLTDYINDYGLMHSEEELRQHGDLWVINDWYSFIPQIKTPDRIWNIHDMENIDCGRKNGRYEGDFKKIYNRCKCPVMSIKEHDLQGLDNVQYLNEEALLKYPVKALSCSISTMMLTAMIEGYTEVSIIGVALNKDEYKFQAQGLLEAKKILENENVSVNMLPSGRLESILNRSVNWSTIEAIQPYWTKEYGK